MNVGESMKQDFTTQQVIEKIKELASEQPDFVYTDQPERVALQGVGGFCGYAGARSGSRKGQGCIVGQALLRLGTPKSDLLAVDGNDALDAMNILGVEVSNTDDALFILDVQTNQDLGQSWMAALLNAQVNYPNYYY